MVQHPYLPIVHRLLNPALTPEKLHSIEAGAEVYFFKDRFGIDVTVYQNTSSDQIINLPASSAQAVMLDVW